MGELEGGQMPRPHRSNPKTKHHAVELRKELTPAERKLWARLRNDQLGVNFRRQHAIANCIPDFVCVQKKLIVELDGSQHLEQENTTRNPAKCVPKKNRDKAGQANDIPGIKRLSHITLLEQ